MDETGKLWTRTGELWTGLEGARDRIRSESESHRDFGKGIRHSTDDANNVDHAFGVEELNRRDHAAVTKQTL